MWKRHIVSAKPLWMLDPRAVELTLDSALNRRHELWLEVAFCDSRKTRVVPANSLASRAKRRYRPGRRRHEAVRPQAARHHYLSQQSPRALSNWVRLMDSGRQRRPQNSKRKITTCARVLQMFQTPLPISAATCACVDLQPGCTWMDADGIFRLSRCFRVTSRTVR